MSMRDNAVPVIIKRKKVVRGGGGHGGAWKVAYADFVTAMMAFFLVMWLLNATTEKQRKGLADYFNPTVPINRVSGGGDGAFGGDSVFSDRQMAQNGTGASEQRPTTVQQAQGAGGADVADGSQDQQQFAQMARDVDSALQGLGGESMATQNLARHIVTRVTDEGLIVEFFDLDGAPLFTGDSATPEPVLGEIAAVLAKVFGLVTNKVALNGHVHAYPAMLRENPVWDLSLARAQAMRALLERKGFDRQRIQRVTGYADRAPATEPPMAARNNRLELILLREQH